MKSVQIQFSVGILLITTLACGSIEPIATIETDIESPQLDVVLPTEFAEQEVDTPANSNQPDFFYDEIATVIWVIDGDTIEVEIDGVDYRVRYIGVNTPERDEVCYDNATAANEALVPEGSTVYLVQDVSDTDRYDRLLRYIYVETDNDYLFVNEELVDAGWAEAVTYEPDTSFADYFYSLEDDARINGRGCHPSGIFD